MERGTLLWYLVSSVCLQHISFNSIDAIWIKIELIWIEFELLIYWKNPKLTLNRVYQILKNEDDFKNWSAPDYKSIMSY